MDEVRGRLFGIPDGYEFAVVRLLKTKREPRMDSRTGWKMSCGTIRNRRNELNARGESFSRTMTIFATFARKLGPKKVKSSHGDDYLLIYHACHCNLNDSIW